MTKVSYGPQSLARRKKIAKRAKGQRGGRSKWHTITMESLNRAMAYATRDRRAKKRTFRSLWVVRIANACKEEGISYSKFINLLSKAKIGLNRKVLADMAMNDKASFSKLVQGLVKT